MSYIYHCYHLDRTIEDVGIEVLLGRTLVSVEGLREGSDRVYFVCADGTKFVMYHAQDCCENVALEEVIGDLSGLLGHPILVAEESGEDASCKPKQEGEYTYTPESATWTFYTLRTVHTTVVLRWWGESNGYYSERVSFARLVEEE